MHDLRFIALHPANPSSSAVGSNPDLQQAVAAAVRQAETGPSFENGFDADSKDELRAALREGWEPFATVSPEPGLIVMSLRRPVRHDDSEILPQDLPGQYL